MKTILVLTDFSINADYAAHYALKFAQKVKANLLLCNIYSAPPAELNAGRKKWPLAPHEQNSVEDLGDIAARLKTAVDAGEKTDFRPEINQCSREGLLKDTVNEIVASHQVVMAIISMHSSTPLTSLFTPDHAWDIIEQADFPLLVIPYQVRFKNYETIALATDLSVTDKYVLNSVAGLAKYSGANILIAHIIKNGVTRQEDEAQTKQFFNLGPLKEDSPAIVYHSIKSGSVIHALTNLLQETSIDMLVLIKRPRSTFKKVFEKDVVRQLAKHPAKPLLIFPETDVLKKLPVF